MTRSQRVKQQEKLILLHWQHFMNEMMKNNTDEEGNAFQWRVRLSLHLFKLLSFSAWLAVTRLTVNSQEQRGSMRWSQIKKCCYYTTGGWEENALVQQSTEKRQMRKFFFFSSYNIFFWSLVRGNGMHWWKMDVLFSQANSSRVVNADGVCAVSPGEK